MSYRWVEHTAELELEIDAPTEEAVFVEALAALAELLSGGDPPHQGDLPPPGDLRHPGNLRHPGEAVSLELSLAGTDRALLLADWLDELVFRAETEDLVPTSVELIELHHGGLNATVGAIRGAPRPLVKGITHHGLAFGRTDRRFRASVVLDV